jgi:hypothetical protein
MNTKFEINHINHIKFDLVDLIEKSEIKIEKIENCYLDGDRYSNEKEWLEELNFVKGRLDGYKRVLNLFEKKVLNKRV